MTLVAMEPPTKVDGPEDYIRSQKVAVLKSVLPINPEDVILGQYEGYTDDPTVPDDSTQVRIPWHQLLYRSLPLTNNITGDVRRA